MSARMEPEVGFCFCCSPFNMQCSPVQVQLPSTAVGNSAARVSTRVARPHVIPLKSNSMSDSGAIPAAFRIPASIIPIANCKYLLIFLRCLI